MPTISHTAVTNNPYEGYRLSFEELVQDPWKATRYQQEPVNPRNTQIQELQTQISLLDRRIETLEELLLEFGIKKVFDKAGDEVDE